MNEHQPLGNIDFSGLFGEINTSFSQRRLIDSSDSPILPPQTEEPEIVISPEEQRVYEINKMGSFFNPHKPRLGVRTDAEKFYQYFKSQKDPSRIAGLSPKEKVMEERTTLESLASWSMEQFEISQTVVGRSIPNSDQEEDAKRSRNFWDGVSEVIRAAKELQDSEQ